MSPQVNPSFKTNFKISVRVRGEWFLVPCSSTQTALWLADEALKRYNKLRPASYVSGRKERVKEIRKTKGGAIIDPEDILTNVLDDNDFVSIGELLLC
jgi:histidine ammonia-lyase